MGAPVNTTELCTPTRTQLQKKIEELLGTWLPDCAEISATEDGGIRAVQDVPFNKVIREVDREGNIYFSNKCGEKWEGRLWEGWPGGLMCASTKGRLRYSHPLDPAKVAEARALLLKEKKPETSPAVVQKNP